MRFFALGLFVLAACASTTATRVPRAVDVPARDSQPIATNAVAARDPLPICDVMGGFADKNMAPPRVYAPVDRVAYFFSEPLRDCGIPQTITLSLEILGHTCGPPFHAINVKWDRIAGNYEEYFDIDHWTQELYRKLWELLLDTVRDIVDPACVYDAAARADQNPRFDRCPMPAELHRAFRFLPDSAEETFTGGYVPAGLYAFVSALAQRDATPMGRMLQLKLLYGAAEAKPVDPRRRPPAHACTPEGFYPNALQPD